MSVSAKMATWPCRPARPAESTACASIRPEKLYLGTMVGLRAFSWPNIVNFDGALPEPAVKVDLADPPSTPGPATTTSTTWNSTPPADAFSSPVEDGEIHFRQPLSGRLGAA